MSRLLTMSSLLVLIAAALSGCASSPDASASDTVAQTATLQADMTASRTLRPQTLQPGECGLFGWTVGASPDFVFFARNGRALYQNGSGEPRVLRTSEPFPALDYGPVELSLGPADEMINGTRYPDARLRETLPDGFTRVQPLVMLESCAGLDMSG